MKAFLKVYAWLIFAMIALFLSGGDRPVEITVWLFPVLLLRFFREVKLWIGLIAALPLITAITLIADKGMTPIPMPYIVWLTLINSAIALIPYAADRLFTRSIQKSIRTFLFPAAAVAVEAFVASGFTGGTWGNPAYGIKNMPLLQMVSISGIWGLLFLIYWTAAVVNEVWEYRHRFWDIRKPAAAFLTVFVAVYGFGLWRLHIEKPSENTVRVAGVTPGPEHREEMMDIFGQIFSSSRTGNFRADSIRSSIMDKYGELLSESTKIADSGVEIVAWSEGAAFIFESDEKVSIQTAIDCAREHGFSLGMGIVVISDNCQELLGNNQPFVRNKLIFITQDGNLAWEYLKSNLAPGFERAMTIPGSGVLRSTDAAGGSVTGAICYDLDFPPFIRQAGKMRSDLLLAPSNDWPEIKNTHAQMARFRAIENGTSLLRPANTGISVAADPYGHIVSYVDDLTSGGAPMAAVLPMGSVQTLYATLGDFWTWVCAAGAILFVILGIAGRFRRSSKSE